MPSPGEALAVDAIGAQVAENRAHSAGNTHCLNCGAALQGPFCHACGQHDFDIHRSFWHTFLEALENIFHFDAKLFRNFVTLLFHPGRLTAAFNAGQRASQVPPFRLYIFTAFVFFLLVFATGTKEDALNFDSTTGKQGGRAGFTLDGQPVSVKQAIGATTNPEFAEELKKELEEIDRAVKAAEAKRPAREKSEFESWAEAQGRRAMEPEFRREIGKRFLSAVPKMLLLCLPFFALFTRFLFRKSGQVYLQHLVVALHFHIFIFIWLMFRDGWAFLLGAAGFEAMRGWFEFACNGWLGLYPVLMLRHLFVNSWKLTFFKSAVLAFCYTLTLAFGFLLTLALLFWLM